MTDDLKVSLNVTRLTPFIDRPLIFNMTCFIIGNPKGE